MVVDKSVDNPVDKLPIILWIKFKATYPQVIHSLSTRYPQGYKVIF